MNTLPHDLQCIIVDFVIIPEEHVALMTSIKNLVLNAKHFSNLCGKRMFPEYKPKSFRGRKSFSTEFKSVFEILHGLYTLAALPCRIEHVSQLCWLHWLRKPLYKRLQRDQA